MPMAPISMRKLKEILRLKHGCLLSHRKIAKSLSISASAGLFMPFVPHLLGSLTGRCTLIAIRQVIGRPAVQCW
jgi:hypothetical protein